MRWDVQGFLEVIIINLVPDAFFITLDNDSSHPMSGAIKDAVAAVGVDVRIFLCITERNRELAYLPFIRDVENRLLIINFNGLHPTGVRVPIFGLVPCAIERIPLLAILNNRCDLHDLIRTEEIDLLGFECWLVIKRRSTVSNTSPFDGRRR